MDGIAGGGQAPDEERVSSLADFVVFTRALAEYFYAHHEDEQAWANVSLGQYLEAIAEWLEATPASAEGQEERGEHIEGPTPTWRGVAMLLTAGRVYE